MLEMVWVDQVQNITFSCRLFTSQCPKQEKIRLYKGSVKSISNLLKIESHLLRYLMNLVKNLYFQCMKLQLYGQVSKI